MLACVSQIDDATAQPDFMKEYLKGPISSESELANIAVLEEVEKRKGRKRKIEPMDLDSGPEDDRRRSVFRRHPWVRWLEFRAGFVPVP